MEKKHREGLGERKVHTLARLQVGVKLFRATLTSIRQMRECYSAVCAHDAHGAVGGHETRAGGEAAAAREGLVHLRSHRAHDRGRARRHARANATYATGVTLQTKGNAGQNTNIERSFEDSLRPRKSIRIGITENPTHCFVDILCPWSNTNLSLVE